MKIFLSSLITGMEDLRAAAAAGVTALGHEVVRAEDFQSSPTSPQVTCLAGVRDSDATVLLMGDRYGSVQQSGLSATHEEFREARERRPVFVFVQDGVTPEPGQAEFIREVQEWATGGFTGQFSSPDDLRNKVTAALHRWEVGQAAGGPGPDEMVARARDLLPVANRGGYAGAPSISVALAGGPRQAVLRPSDLESPALRDQLQQNAMFGDNRVFDPQEGARVAYAQHEIAVSQNGQMVKLDEQGSMLLTLSLIEGRGGIGAVIEEDVAGTLLKALNFASHTLDQIDPVERLSHVVLVAQLNSAGYLGWRTRAEHQASPNSGTMNMWGEDGEAAVSLSPPLRPRATLRRQARELADDLTVLMRRRFRR